MVDESIANLGIDDSEEENSVDGPSLSVEDGLSAEVLAALMEFQQSGGFFEQAEEIPKNAVCATFTAGDSQMIASTLKRLQEKDNALAQVHEEQLRTRKMTPLLPPNEICLREALERDGVVRINGVLSEEIADSCLQQINEEFVTADARGVGFGNVFSRHNRYDMYLRSQGVYELALKHMLCHGTVLGDLFEKDLLQERPGVFHEFSSLISDPGSDCQAIHPDSPYDHFAPMWTVFVALQDIDEFMGATVFLPGTQTKDSHDQLKTPELKDALLAKSRYVQATMKKGDCTVMDARTLHYGDANVSERRRVLLYFTIRNPLVNNFPPQGSLFPGLELTTQLFY